MTRRTAGEGMIRQRPNGLWEARYTAADGRTHSIYRKTRREASDKLRAAIADRDKGLRPVDQRLTTGAYLDDWLVHHVKPNVRATTYTSYEGIVRLYHKPALGRIALARLEPEDVQRMLAAVSAKGVRGDLSPTTVRYCYSVLRIALGRALKLGRVHRNVATLIDAPAKVRTELQPFSAEQVRGFLSTLTTDRRGVLYLTALGTGLRQGELLGLQWADLDLDGRRLMVRHTLQRGTGKLVEPKTDRARRNVSLPVYVTDAIREHRRRQLEDRLAAGDRWRDRDLVFTTALGRPLDPRNVLRAYHAALAAAGLPRQPFHHLRHACATLLLESGEELANVSKILGHADLGTTADLYAHLTPGIARRAADRMDSILAG